MSEAASCAASLGTYIATAHGRACPPEVIDAARLCLADWLAVAIGAAGEDAGRIVRATVAGWGAAGSASVIFGRRTTPAFAALANGTLAHCLDFDDTYVPAVTHTSAPVWAAVLALAEARNAPEAAMLQAFVTGFEVAARVGHGLGQGLTARGLHSTGVFGRIGAAAGSAALLGLDGTRAVNALAAAATQASGLTASFGTMAKPFHAGKAAMDGVLSAELAVGGFVAAPATLAPGGLDKALIQDGSLAFAPLDFSGWRILANSFKPYAACHLVHPSVDAARTIGRPLADVRRVEARVFPLAMQITGGADGRPPTSLAAKFDLRYCVGLGLAGHACSAADFREPWSPDPAALGAAALVTPAADAGIGFAGSELRVEYRDGRHETIRIAAAKGDPGNPMRWDDMWAKFEALVSPQLGRTTEALFEAARTLGAGGSRARMTDILGGLRAPESVPSGSQPGLREAH